MRVDTALVMLKTKGSNEFKEKGLLLFFRLRK
jgi:hypothetical protein